MKGALKWLWIVFVGMPRVWIGDIGWIATFWGIDGRHPAAMPVAMKARKVG